MPDFVRSPRDRLFQLRLSESEHARLTEAASSLETTVSDFIRAAIDEYMTAHVDTKKPKRKKR